MMRITIRQMLDDYDNDCDDGSVSGEKIVLIKRMTIDMFQQCSQR